MVISCHPPAFFCVTAAKSRPRHPAYSVGHFRSLLYHPRPPKSISFSKKRLPGGRGKDLGALPQAPLRKLLRRSFLRTFKNFPQGRDSATNPALGGKFLEIFKRLFSKSLLNGVWGNAPRSSRPLHIIGAKRRQMSWRKATTGLVFHVFSVISAHLAWVARKSALISASVSVP